MKNLVLKVVKPHADPYDHKNVGIKTYVDSSDRGATGHKNMIINDEKLIRELIIPIKMKPLHWSKVKPL